MLRNIVLTNSTRITRV